MRRPLRRTAVGALALLLPLLLAACNDDAGSAEDLCAAVADNPDLSTAMQGFDPTDPETALTKLRDARVGLGDLLDDAPKEIKDDLQVEIDYLQALIEALETVDAGDATESALQVHAVTEAHPDVDEAAANLAAFAQRECTL